MFERSNVSRSCPDRRRLCCPFYAVRQRCRFALSSSLPCCRRFQCSPRRGPVHRPVAPGPVGGPTPSRFRPPPNPSRSPCRFRQRPAASAVHGFRDVFHLSPRPQGTLADALFPFLCDCHGPLPLKSITRARSTIIHHARPVSFTDENRETIR